MAKLPPAEIEQAAEAHWGTNDEFVAEVKSAIDELSELDGRRDIGTIDLDNYPHWITGGMGWGDAPTDAFSTLCSLKSVPALVDQMALWAQEDLSKP